MTFKTFTKLAFTLFVLFTHQDILKAQASENHSAQNPYPNSIVIDGSELTDLMNNDPFELLSVLSLQTGLTFHSTGDFGAEDWFTIRGFGRDNSRMTLIVLDGRPLNLSNNHTVEFDDVPASIIDQITIYPGPVPARFGGYQTVIEIDTKRDENIRSLNINAGSYETYKLDATIAGSGDFHYLVHLNGLLTDARSEESLSGILDQYTYSDRSLRSLTPMARIGYSLNDHFDLSFQANFIEDKKMFSSEPLFGEEASRVRSSQNFLISLRPTRASNLDYQFNAYTAFEYETLNAPFPEDELYDVGFGEQNRNLTGFNGFYRYPISEQISVTAGANFQTVSGRSTRDESYFVWTDSQRHFGAFLESNLSLFEGSRITLGARVDRQSQTDASYISPNLAVSQRLFNDRLEAYTAYGVIHRWIPLNEVNSFNRGPRAVGPPFLQGNISLPDLTMDMERMTAWDIGLRSTLMGNRLNLRMNYFLMRNHETFGAPMFEVRPAREGAELPPGVEAAPVTASRNLPGFEENSGIEMQAKISLHPRYRLVFNATRFLTSETRIDSDITLYEGPMGGPSAQEVLNQSVGQFIIPYAGERVIPGGYNWLANANALFQLTPSLSADAIVRYRSENVGPLMKFGTDPQVDEINSFFTVDSGISYRLLERENLRLNFSLSVYNIFNTDYQTFVHYPMPGRFIDAGISISFL